MLCLSANDLWDAVSMNSVMDTIERALRMTEEGKVLMPPRAHVDYGDDTLLLMPCFTDEGFGTKLVTVFPGAVEHGAPVVNGVVLLNDAATGAPVALLNGQALTAMRTGAAGGVSVRYLARDNSSTVGVVGAGVQGLHQAMFAAAARPVKDVYVYDLVPAAIEVFRTRFTAVHPGVRVHAAQSSEELVKASDIVMTATTSTRPVLPDDSALLEGKHFVAIGSFKPNMRELPQALFGLLDNVFVDTEHALQETGDLSVPLENGWIAKDQVRSLGSYLMEDTHDPVIKETTTLFKCVGMAVFDLTVAQLVYNKARELRLGLEVEL